MISVSDPRAGFGHKLPVIVNCHRAVFVGFNLADDLVGLGRVELDQLQFIV